MLVKGMMLGAEPGTSVLLKPGAKLELEIKLEPYAGLMLVIKLKPDAGPYKSMLKPVAELEM